jgi:hypothetical protein
MMFRRAILWTAAFLAVVAQFVSGNETKTPNMQASDKKSTFVASSWLKTHSSLPKACAHPEMNKTKEPTYSRSEACSFADRLSGGGRMVVA